MDLSFERAIYQLKRILEHSQVTDESRHNDEYLLDKIFYYRALVIGEENRKSLRFDSNWLSETGTLEGTEVYSGDVPEITSGDIVFSKFQLPTVVPLKNNMGYFNLFSLSQNKKIYRVDSLADIMNWIMVNDTRVINFTHAAIIGSDAYVFPAINKMQAQLVMENPLNGKIKQTQKVLSGSIVAGETYVVNLAQIIYNSVLYSPGDTFTGVSLATTFTGNGSVYYNNRVRSVRYSDRFPISTNMFRDIITMLMQVEYGVEMKMIPDEINDSKAESNLAP